MRTLCDGRALFVRVLAVALLLPAGVVAAPGAARAATADAPDPATNLQASVVDIDAVKLTWNNPANPLNLSETIIRGKEGTAAPTSKTDGFGVNPDGSLLPSATASNLPDPNTPYSFAVFACSASGECAAPATVTVDSYQVTASVSRDRITYSDTVNVKGKVVDALTGTGADYLDIRIVALLPDGSAELVDEDLSRTGGVFKIPLQPARVAQLAVLVLSDATHLGGLGLTSPVYVSADTALVPVTTKGRLGTTFSLVGGAGPVARNLPVVLQEKLGSTWRTVLKQKPNKNGLTTFKVKPTKRGKHVYRVTRAATAGVGPGTSSSLTITVT